MQGIRVSTEVAIDDPNGLGHHIAGMASDRQAQVIVGFTMGIEALDVVASGKQLLYIAEALMEMSPGRSQAVRSTLEMLLDFIVGAAT